MTKVQDIVHFLNQTAPFAYQEAYDNSGLIVGSPKQDVNGILVSLDCTEAIIDEAIAIGANVIVSHHPIVFKGLKRFTGSNYVERTVIKAIENKIALIAIHTNLDNYRYGVNHVIANKLGLINQQILAPKEATLYKVGVYVPVTHAEDVRIALAKAGAGKIGDYSDCSFSSEGEGRFKPSEEAKPFIGNAGEMEVVQETRIEVIVEKHALKNVLSAMVQAHPYEEVAHDVVALDNKNAYIGSGMLGELSVPENPMVFLQKIKDTFNCGVVRYTNICTDKIVKVAVCGGSGGFLLPDAKRAGADVFITADYKYHEFFDAENELIIADIGHFESEQYTSDYLVALLMKKFTNFAVRLANVSTNPIKYL